MNWIILGTVIGGSTLIYGLIRRKKIPIIIGAIIYAVAYALAWELGG